MKIFFQYLKFITSAFLVIFILGSKPSKVKGQEPETDDGPAYVYCFSENDGKGIANTKALAKIICTDKDRVWTITYNEDGDMKLVVKKKKDGKSEADTYLIESGSRTGKK